MPQSTMVRITGIKIPPGQCVALHLLSATDCHDLFEPQVWVSEPWICTDLGSSFRVENGVAVYGRDFIIGPGGSVVTFEVVEAENLAAVQRALMFEPPTMHLFGPCAA